MSNEEVAVFYYLVMRIEPSNPFVITMSGSFKEAYKLKSRVKEAYKGTEYQDYPILLVANSDDSLTSLSVNDDMEVMVVNPVPYPYYKPMLSAIRSWLARVKTKSFCTMIGGNSDGKKLHVYDRFYTFTVATFMVLDEEPIKSVYVRVPNSNQFIFKEAG